MKTTLILLLWVPFSGWTQDIPPELQKGLSFEKEFNISRRSRGRFPPPRTDNLPLDVYEVPASWAQVYQDPETPPQALKWVHGDNGGVLIYLPPSLPLLESYDKGVIHTRQLLRANGMTPVRQIRGSLLISHYTWRVWNPVTKESVDLKIRPDESMEDENHKMTEETMDLAKRSVAINQAVRKIFKDPDRKVGFYLPEPMGVQLRIPQTPNETPHIPFGYVVRLSQDPEGVLYTPKSPALPLHGVLGNRAYLEKLATAAGKTVPQWLRDEYLPTVSQFLAEMHFRHGLYPEGHSQNTVGHFDETTGKIQGLGFRDDYDLSFDFFSRAMKRRSVHFDPVRGLQVGQLYRFHRAFSPPHFGRNLDGPEHIFADFTVQLLGNTWHQDFAPFLEEATKNLVHGKRGVIAFFELYKKDAAKIMGPEVFNRLTQYQHRRAQDRQRAQREFLPLGILRKPSASVQEMIDLALDIREFYEGYFDAVSPQFDRSITGYDQNYLAKIVDSKYEVDQVALNRSGSRSWILKHDLLKYGFDGNGILIVGPNDTQVIGYVHSLTEEEKAEIRKHHLPSSCPDLSPLKP